MPLDWITRYFVKEHIHLYTKEPMISVIWNDIKLKFSDSPPSPLYIKRKKRQMYLLKLCWNVSFYINKWCWWLQSRKNICICVGGGLFFLTIYLPEYSTFLLIMFSESILSHNAKKSKHNQSFVFLKVYQNAFQTNLAEKEALCIYIYIYKWKG